MPIGNQKRSIGNGLSSNQMGNTTAPADDQLSDSENPVCAFGVLLLKIKPECCFLKINEKGLSSNVDVFWEPKPLGKDVAEKPRFISVSYQLCVFGQIAEPLYPLMFSSIKWEQTHLRPYAFSNYDNEWDALACAVSWNIILLASYIKLFYTCCDIIFNFLIIIIINCSGHFFFARGHT